MIKGRKNNGTGVRALIEVSSVVRWFSSQYWSQTPWVQIPVWSLPSCVTSGCVICVSLPVLWSPYLQNEDSKRYLPQRVVVWIPWLKNQIIPGWGLACCKGSVKSSHYLRAL